jgi:ABC-type antimicrobial peptide transport system permease subunit
MMMDRVLAALSSFFAIAAVVLGSIGVYGSLSYTASRRTGEMGIRVALGATARQVRWLIMRESAAISLAGVTLGLLGSLALARFVGSLLYRLSPEDPAALALAAAFVIGACLFSAFLPARRASRIEPSVALRVE